MAAISAVSPQNPPEGVSEAEQPVLKLFQRSGRFFAFLRSVRRPYLAHGDRLQNSQTPSASFAHALNGSHDVFLMGRKDASAITGAT